MHDQSPALDWRDTPLGAVPVSTRFEDPYYSLDDGPAETMHVFVNGNDLGARWGKSLHVAELGFGTGLNFLVTWTAWDRAGRPAPLRFTSFEAYPLPRTDMTRALSAFPTLAPEAAGLLAHLEGADLPDGLSLELVVGDARQTVPRWQGMADAWFLDGFAPARNPELWEPGLLHAVARHTSPGGTAATYSAAGHVRAGLATAGFVVSRSPGYGRKRHMTTARKPPDAE